MPQLQHNMWVIASCNAVLSVIIGGGKWVEIAVHGDPLPACLFFHAAKKFWRWGHSGEAPSPVRDRAATATFEAVGIVDMSAPTPGPKETGVFRRTREPHVEHESPKAELKALLPEHAKEAIGHGTRAKSGRSALKYWPSRARRRSPMHWSSESIGAIVAALAKDKRS